MNKIYIAAEKTQSMTAEEINALAQHILNKKGQVDFTGTSATITPPDDMNADMAGIIVKCASTQNGTVNISGATEITDEQWAGIEEYGCDLWMINLSVKYGYDLGSMIALQKEYANFSNPELMKTAIHIESGTTLYPDIAITTDLVEEVRFKITTSTSDGCISNNGSWDWNNRQRLWIWSGTLYGWYGRDDNFFNCATDVKHHVISANGYLTLDGTTKTWTEATSASGSLCMFTSYESPSGSEYASIGDFYEYIIKKGDTVVKHYLPFVRNSKAGFIDLVSMEFVTATNGSFTIVEE